MRHLRNICQLLYSTSRRFNVEKLQHFGQSGFRIGATRWISSDVSAPVTLSPSSLSSRFSAKDEKKLCEFTDSHAVFDLICETLQQKNVNLVFSDSFLSNLETSGLAKLMKLGPSLLVDYVVEAFVLRPKFMEIGADQWAVYIDAFRENGISPAIALAAAVGNPDSLQMSQSRLKDVFIQLANLNLGDRVIPALLAKRPEILSMNIDDLLQNAENLRSFFSKKQLTMMVRRNPDILLEKFDDLEEKYEYFYYEMGLEPADVCDSRKWHKISFVEARCRHEFLIRCGVYIKPSLKREDVSKENPSLRLILDSDDNDFAKLGHVQHVEWVVFKKIFVEEVASTGYRRDRTTRRNENQENDYKMAKPFVQRPLSVGEQGQALTQMNRMKRGVGYRRSVADEDDDNDDDDEDDKIDDYNRPNRNNEKRPSGERKLFRKSGVYRPS